MAKATTKLKDLHVRKVDFVDSGANQDAHIKLVKRREDTEDTGGKGIMNILEKMFHFIGKAAGIDQEEIDGAMDEIQKGDAVSFNEKITEVKNYKIADEMWDTCYALQSALCSILNDEELDSSSAETAMKESLDEFYAVVQESIKDWSSGKEANIKKNDEISKEDLEIMKSAVERLNGIIEKSSFNIAEMKGDGEEMKIDKSKLTAAERAFLADIEKRCGTEDDGAGADNSGIDPAPEGQEQNPHGPAVVKSAQRTERETPTQQAEEPDDIYKGLNPVVAAELKILKKFREQAEEKELSEIAGKYEIIGKKKEELVPLLKSLKKAGGTAYDDMIAILDHTVATVEKSGIFSEIGKSGGNYNGNYGNVLLAKNATEAETKIEAIAKGYMEKDPSMEYTTALAKAWEDNPELLDAYDEEAGF